MFEGGNSHDSPNDNKKTSYANKQTTEIDDVKLPRIEIDALRKLIQDLLNRLVMGKLFLKHGLGENNLEKLLSSESLVSNNGGKRGMTDEFKKFLKVIATQVLETLLAERKEIEEEIRRFIRSRKNGVDDEMSGIAHLKQKQHSSQDHIEVEGENISKLQQQSLSDDDTVHVPYEQPLPDASDGDSVEDSTSASIEIKKNDIEKAGWKEKRKAYLSAMQKKGREQDDEGRSEESGKRKRRSRWDIGPNLSNGEEKEGGRCERQSRWEEQRSRGLPSIPGDQVPCSATSAVAAAVSQGQKPTAETGILGLLPGVPQGMTQDQLTELSALQARLRRANEKLSSIELEAARVDNLPRGHPDRSPSPPPVYGADGKRKNTRAVRWRFWHSMERQDCLEKIMDLNPALLPPGFVKRKRSKKIYVPVHEHPTYNFIGLIIGPRGKTKKEMEAKTSCKIAIRGKGSVKEGARGRRDGKPIEGDDEPLHVVITGDEQASVDQAAQIVQDMLIVIDDDKNVLKQQQLRELALLNGTLKDEEYCHLCADKGHRSFECPQRIALNNKQPASVKCTICGETSHPTRDCPVNQQNHQDQHQLDSDYQSFMAELDGRDGTHPPPPPKTSDTAPNLQPPHAYPNYNYAAYNYPLPYANPNQPAMPQPPMKDETAAWNYRSYFGTEATGGDASGAGGFNWWET